MILDILRLLWLRRLFGPEMLADPYPVYARLRSISPVCWVRQVGGWVVTRYADVMTVLRSPSASCERAALLRERISDEFEPVIATRANSMLNVDAPRHTRMRLLVNTAFTPRTVEGLAPFVQRFVNQVLDEARPRGRMDVIGDLANPLPATVIAELLGVPPSDRGQFKTWSVDITAAVSNIPANIPPDVLRQSMIAMEELREYFRAIIAQRRAEPRGDLISALVRAQEEGDRLSDEELLANAVLLLNAGHETTTNLIGNGTLALLRHPDQLQRLRDDPTLIPSAVEELLRYDSPVQFTSRILKADMVLGRKRLRAGQITLLLLGAANRDPEQFPDPDRLDVARADNKHLAFGLGPHFCLGAPLARLEGRIVFETLVQRFPALRLDGSAPEYRQNFNLRGLKSLQVAFS